MVLNPIVTENFLDDWVQKNSEIAKGIIVDLISYLVSLSSPNPKDIRFQRRDSIGQHGADGFLDPNISYPPYIPEGKSYWEIGSGKDEEKKQRKITNL